MIGKPIGENKNLRTKNFLDSLTIKSSELFSSLIEEINPESKTLELNRLKGFLNLHSEKEKFDEHILKIINSYHVHQKIMNRDPNFNANLEEEDFNIFTTGREVKSLLFDKSLDQKREAFEDLVFLYNLMGGDKDGISIDNLNKSISKVIDFYSDPITYMKDDYDPNVRKPISNGEAQEIIDILCEGNDRLTLKEFVNIMTSEFSSEFEAITIDSPHLMLNKVKNN